MRFRAFKYISPAIFYITAWAGFTLHGIVCFLPLIYAWLLIPVAELFWSPDYRNLASAEEEMARRDGVYDYLLYFFVLVQVAAVFFFLHSMQEPSLSVWDKVGRIGTMGLLCGIFGINIGHELGHRVAKGERALAKLSLLTALYMHFYIEHNKGHHKKVGTTQDPASARLGESLYQFWPRSVVMGYISAWQIAARDRRKRGKAVISIHNEMVQVHFIEAAFITGLLLLSGPWPVLYFLLAALKGILLLETVNYIEHYGLSRQQIAENKYERVMPHHSWNSNHVFGRLMLFELSRHSDHHYLASRKYQLLRHQEAAPQLPTGYPGMMILALVPPAWFYVMNPKIEEMKNERPDGLKLAEAIA